MPRKNELEICREIEDEAVRILDRITISKKRSWTKLNQSGIVIYQTKFNHAGVVVEVSLVIGENGPMLIIKEGGPDPSIDRIVIMGSEVLDNLVESVEESIEGNKA